MRRFLLILACLFTWPAAAQQAAPRAAPIRIGEVRVHLFQEGTGTLSENLLGRNPRVLGNVIIADDPANAFLVIVRLDGPPDSFQERAELQITVRTQGPRPGTVERRFSGLLFGRTGRVHKAIMVHDQVCAPADIEVRIGRETRRATLGFRCGE
jgi:hypothetical protein